MSLNARGPGDDLVRAMLDPAHPTNDPVAQALQLAMTGFGYNFYDAKNVARSNDVLVRARAGELLSVAARAVARLERGYRDRFSAPPSREQPFPSPDVARRATALHRLEQRLDGLAASIATMEAPPPDAIWSRIRDEAATLERLLAFDVALVARATEVERLVGELTTLACDADDALEPVTAALDALERSFSERRALLSAL